MGAQLSIVIVEEDRDRATAIVDGLRESGDHIVRVIGNVSSLARQIASHSPDVVLIDIDNPIRDMLEELTLASGPLERPVAMFVSGAAWRGRRWRPGCRPMSLTASGPSGCNR